MKRITTAIIAALVLLGALAGGLSTAACGGVPGDAVATVGDVSVTKTRFDEILTQAKAQMESQGTTFPTKGSASYDQLVAQAVDYLVQAQVVAQSAEDLGVSVTDKAVADQVAQIEESYGGEAKVLALLKEQGMTMDLLKWSIKDQLLSQQVAAAVVAKAAVSDAELRDYWKQNAARLRKKKKTATFAKAKTTIRTTLLDQAKQKLWTAWLTERTEKLGVEYAAGYDPADATASPSPSASANAGG